MQGANAGAGGGLGLGLMGGLAAVNPAMLAVAAAAYAAAAALRYIGSETIKADRADLMLRLAATPDEPGKPGSGQQGIIRAAVDKYVKETAGHPIKLTKAEMTEFMVGILGDVGGKSATERATAAAAIAPKIADTFIPLAYGLGGAKQSREESIANLNTIVKGLNIASGDLTNAAGQLTKDGQRVFEGVALAKAMNPQLEAERIRTVLANLKTAAFTLEPEALARVLSAGGDRGVRVANELYQAMRSMSGVVDNKALNRGLQKLGLLTGGTPLPGKAGRAGGIVPGSGNVVDSDLLRTNPFEWIIKNVLPKMEKIADKSLTKAEVKAGEERARVVREEGGTEQEIADARAPLRSRMQTILDQAFPGMAATARTALSDAIFSHVQQQGTVAQGRIALDNLRQKGGQIFGDSIAAQLSNLKATLDTKAQELGTSVSKGLGLSAIIKEINDALADPSGPARANLVAKGQEALMMTPAAQAGRLLWEAAQLFYKGAAWIASKLGIGPDPSATSGAISQVDAQTTADATKRGQVLNDIMRLEGELKKAQSDLRNAPWRGKANEQRKANLASLVARIEADLEEARANAAGLKAYLEQRQKDLQQKKEEDDKKYPSDFIGPLPPGAEKRAEATTPEVQSMLAAIDTAPGKFNEAFGTLPAKGQEGGTNFSTTAMTTINSGAAGAGGIFGDNAVARIRAGVANIQLAATVNVKNVEGSSDQGQRTAVG